MTPALLTGLRRRFGIQAGAIETSMTLHLPSDPVQMHKAQNFRCLRAAMENEGYRRLSSIGSRRIGWMA